MARGAVLWLAWAMGLAGAAVLAAETAADGAAREVRVTLLEAGSEPRQVLRVTPTKGAVQTTTMTMTMEMAMVVTGFAPPPQKLPPMRTTMAVEVDDVSPEGDISYTFTMEKAEVLPADGVPANVVEMLETRLVSMEGLKGTGRATSRGVTQEAEIEIPEDVDAQTRPLLESMKQSLDQFSAPYPEEPVGLGASWEVEIPMKHGGIESVTVATYTLERVTDGGCTLAVTMRQAAEPQDIDNPQLPAGTTMRVDDLQASGSGTLTITFGHIMPASSTMKLASALETTIDVGGRKQGMTMKSDIEVEIESRERLK